MISKFWIEMDLDIKSTIIEAQEHLHTISTSYLFSFHIACDLIFYILGLCEVEQRRYAVGRQSVGGSRSNAR